MSDSSAPAFLPRLIKVAATQMACSSNSRENEDRAERLVREAAAKGAKIILLQELFQNLYFCQEQKPKYFEWAHEEQNNSLIERFARVATELEVVIPVSFFEKSNNCYYNSIVCIDSDGSILGKYRKSHIPDGPGYQEKFYFTPGDTGFKVFRTRYAVIGIGICWDQWFPEAARAMALQGAEILLYPTAIGSEPENPGYDSAGHWQRTMIGHSAGNMVPVIASNRIGTETFSQSSITFYGSSFITNNTGEVVAHADRQSEGVIVADLDLSQFAVERSTWGLFRDRRTDLYPPILTKDGSTTQPR